VGNNGTVTQAPVGTQTAISGTWTVGARLVSRLVDLGTLLVLAHILRPQDFGLVAIAMTIIFVLEAALELPISQALIRLPRITRAQYDTAFTLGLLRGLLLSGAVCASSVPFARFYGDVRLVPLACWLSLAPAARGLISPRMADFARKLQYSREFAIELSGKLVAFCSALSIAIIFRSYWSIAVGTVAAPVAAAIVSYVLAPYRPRITISEFSSFSGFLGWITVAQGISAANFQFDRLLLGKLTSRSELGLFTTANDTANIPLLTLFGPILRPLLSAFALLRNDLQRLQNSYQISSAAMVTLALPVLVGESLIAGPAVRLMFGEKWAGAAPMLRWLAISLIPSIFAMPVGPLVMSLDKTKVFVQRNALEIAVKLPLVVIGAIHFRFFGVIFARLLSELVTAVFSMTIVRRMIHIPLREQIIAPWRGITSSIAMAAVLLIAVPQLTHASGVVPLLIGTLLSIMLGAVVYTSTLLGLWIVSGFPPGLEAMAVDKISKLFKRPTDCPALLRWSRSLDNRP
jgi:PST family polysaccharide transporter